jgi:hypothetical protein
MGSHKRKWSKVSSAERRSCETPGCTVLSRERCKQYNCNQQHCEQHKGAHSAIHTLMKQRGLIQGVASAPKGGRRWRNARPPQSPRPAVIQRAEGE